MIQALIRLIRSWLFADRIRIAPADGRLLSLRPGQRILVRQRVCRVIELIESGTSALGPVTISLQTDDGPAFLTIQRTAGGTCQSAQLLDAQGRREDIFDADVQILTSRNHSVTRPPADDAGSGTD